MSAGLTTLAFCWVLERGDGAGLALTSHDRPIMRHGLRFEPTPGITPAAIRSELGLEPRRGEIRGSLSSRAISEQDLTCGRWDGAALQLTAVDWTVPDIAGIDLLSGELGGVSSNGSAFETELLGAAAKLEQPICPLTSPECRAELGDDLCRVDMAGRRIRARIVGTLANRVSVDRTVGEQFRFGRMKFLAGPANGEWRTILAANGAELLLRSAPAGEVAPGTPVEIVEGCDKRLSTCTERFANAANFRGEPHLPGNDLLTRYPGA